VPDQLAVTADVGSDQHPSLRHCFERLERRDEFGQPDRQTRIGEDVDQFVITLHFGVRHPAGENHPFLQAGGRHLRLQLGFLGTAADQQQAQLRLPGQQQADRLDQQIESFIAIERTGKADDDRAIESQRPAKSGIRRVVETKQADVHGVRDHRDALRWDAAPGNVVAQTLADRRYLIGEVQRQALESA
jgi:hypothetical protein